MPRLDISSSVFVTGGVTSSLQGTATTASFVTTAQTASFVTASKVFGKVSTATTADTASYVSSSAVVGTVLSASHANNTDSASYIQLATSASFASSASIADTASYAYPEESNHWNGMACDSFQDYAVGALTAATWNKGVGWFNTGSSVISASIVAYTASNGRIQNCLAMPSGSQIIRKFAWGSSWQKLHICALLATTMTASYTASRSGAGGVPNYTTTLQLGVIAGTGSILNGQSASLGMRVFCDNNDRVVTATQYQACGVTASYLDYVFNHNYDQSGSVYTNDDGPTGTPGTLIPSISGSPGLFGLWQFVITRPSTSGNISGSYSLSTAGPNSTTVLLPAGFGQIKAALMTERPSSTLGTTDWNTIDGNPGNTLTWDEARFGGLFDSVAFVAGMAQSGSSAQTKVTGSLYCAGLFVWKIK